MEPQKKSKFVKGALIIGLVIVINLFFNYTLSLVYPEPEFLTYCPNSQVIEEVNTQAQCVSKGGQWNGNYPVAPGEAVSTTAPQKPTGYCDLNYTCQKNYMEASKVYDRNVFVVLVLLGAITLALGVYAFGSNTVLMNALSYAGVLSFIIASVRYWSAADSLIKVVILALALALLITIAIKKFKE